MIVSGPLSHKVLRLLVDGKEYTATELIENDLMIQRSNALFRLQHVIENSSDNNEEYLISRIAASHNSVNPINLGNLSKTIKNLIGLGLIHRKLVIKKGKEMNYYYLRWPDSHYHIVIFIEHSIERYTHEIELEDLADQKSVKKYENLDSKRGLCKQTLFLFKDFIEESENRQKKEQEAAYLNEKYPIAEPWSPHLSEFMRLVISIKSRCKSPDKSPDDVFARLIIYELRPELLNSHFKWLEENPLPVICDDKKILYRGYYYWYHLDDAPFQPSRKVVLTGAPLCPRTPAM